jgi:hypothetical protein
VHHQIHELEWTPNTLGPCTLLDLMAKRLFVQARPGRRAATATRRFAGGEEECDRPETPKVAADAVAGEVPEDLGRGVTAGPRLLDAVVGADRPSRPEVDEHCAPGRVDDHVARLNVAVEKLCATPRPGMQMVDALGQADEVTKSVGHGDRSVGSQLLQG